MHDVIQQHLHALQAMKHEPSSSFLMYVIELKLDVDMIYIFEWQKHSQANTDFSHYQDLLEFLDLQAQTFETTVPRCIGMEKEQKQELGWRVSVLPIPAFHHREVR